MKNQPEKLFEIDDKVKLNGNPFDEQLGEFADMTVIHTVIATRDVSKIAGAGKQWIKTDKYSNEWISSLWFDLIKPGVISKKETTEKTVEEWEEKFNFLLAEYASWEIEAYETGAIDDQRIARREEFKDFIRRLLTEKEREIEILTKTLHEANDIIVEFKKHKDKQKEEIIAEIEKMKGSKQRLNKDLMVKTYNATHPIKRAVLYQKVYEQAIDDVITNLKQKG